MTAQPITPASDETSPAMAIYRQFRGLIVSGQLGAGERLPTVRQTAADLGVAPGTAAKAYKLLERDGLVTTRTAAGTRVAEGRAVLSGSIVRRLRELIAAADTAHANRDDVIDALRLMWPIAQDQTHPATASDTRRSPSGASLDVRKQVRHRTAPRRLTIGDDRPGSDR